MTTVFSPNIVIAKSYNAIRKFMDSPNGKVSNFDIKDSQDIILFSKSQNKYVYGLEHNHGYSSGDVFIKLKILDSDGSFEQDFFNEDTLLSTAVAGIRKRIQQTKSLRDFAGSLYKASRSRINIYLAYGIGDDLINWTNPITAQLRGIDIDVSNNGLRSYTYTFTPLLNNFLLPQVKKDPDNPNEDYLLDFNYATAQIEAKLNLRSNFYYDSALDKFNANIKYLLTDFCSQACNIDSKQIICLLPDFEEKAKKYPVIAYKETVRQAQYRIFKCINTVINPSKQILNIKNVSRFRSIEDVNQLNDVYDKLIKENRQRLSKTMDNFRKRGAPSWQYQAANEESIFIEKDLKKQRDLLIGDLAKSSPQTWDVALTMYSKSDYYDRDKKDTPFPNFRVAITDIFNGISTFLSGVPVTESIAFESDTRWLKLFKEVGLIADETQPCLIVGERQMVLDYIYCNQVPSSDLNNIKCIFDINKNDSYYGILTSQEYKQKVIDIVNRKKISSSFSEKIVLDELAYATAKDKQGDTKAAIDAALNYATTNDIPFFINNFRNSNVISFSLKNTETYFGSVQQAVYDDRLKNMFGQITEEDIRGLLQPLGLDPKTGLDGFVKKYIDLAERQLSSAGFYDKKNDKVDELVLGREEYLKIYSEEYARRISKLEDRNARISPSVSYDVSSSARDLAGAAALGAIRDKFKSSDDQNFYKLLRVIGNENILLTNSVENVTYLNVALQQIFLQDKKIPKEEVFFLSDFIIALNAVMQVNGQAGLKIIPGLTLPGKEFILSRINEYNIRNSRLLNIKTLPFFTLSNQRTINKPSVFYSKRITPIGKQSNFVLDYFSGEYRITGFRHVIGINECYSEFSLTKYNTTS